MRQVFKLILKTKFQNYPLLSLVKTFDKSAGEPKIKNNLFFQSLSCKKLLSIKLRISSMHASSFAQVTTLFGIKISVQLGIVCIEINFDFVLLGYLNSRQNGDSFRQHTPKRHSFRFMVKTATDKRGKYEFSSENGDNKYGTNVDFWSKR